MGETIAGLSFGALPGATVHATRRALLDGLGVMLAATRLAPEAGPFHDRAVADGGTPESRLLASGARVPASAAAFANGALAHALDFGDTYDAGPAHPNAALIPALLALADANPGIDGGQLLTAMAAGSDLACRMSRAPARPYEEGGWYPPPLFGAVAAAAGCAKLIGLDGDGIVQAMGLAMCQASFPGEIKHDGRTQLRAVREAFAARAAVSAALLARDGVRGFEAPLEGKAGFFALYGGGGFDRAMLLDRLGERFLGDDVSFKPWPSCRGTHAYIEAALALRETIGGREIASIEAEIGPVQEMLMAPLAAKAAPASAIDAKFSIPFTTAHALVHGVVDLDSFGPEARADHDVLAMAAKVIARSNPAWGRTEAASGGLVIILTNGERLERQVPQAAGHPSRPLADAALVAKFLLCAERATLPVDARGMANAVLALGAAMSAISVLRGLAV
jgi:2-methylcitrate dehydratase PrpD